MLNIIWLLLTVVVLMLLVQSFGVVDLPGLRGLARSLPFDLGFLAAAPQATPSPRAAVASPVATQPRPTAAAAGSTVQSGACRAAAPSFVHGLADLKAAVGSDMGEPLECEHVVDAAGNTEQRTTTGLAYYRAATNTAAFTNGAEHWALTGSGLAHWTGEELEPPRTAQP